jgi:hypothetical protein
MIYISDPDLKGRPCSARTLSKICKVNDTQKCHVVSIRILIMTVISQTSGASRGFRSPGPHTRALTCRLRLHTACPRTSAITCTQ